MGRGGREGGKRKCCILGRKNIMEIYYTAYKQQTARKREEQKTGAILIEGSINCFHTGALPVAKRCFSPSLSRLLCGLL